MQAGVTGGRRLAACRDSAAMVSTDQNRAVTYADATRMDFNAMIMTGLPQKSSCHQMPFWVVPAWGRAQLTRFDCRVAVPFSIILAESEEPRHLIPDLTVPSSASSRGCMTLLRRLSSVAML